MKPTKEELHQASPYPEVYPKPQSCTFCGANTAPRIVKKNVPNYNITIDEAHWICGRCNNRFQIGRVRV